MQPHWPKVCKCSASSQASTSQTNESETKERKRSSQLFPPSFIRTLNLKNNKLTSRCCAAIRDVLVTTHLQQVTHGTMEYQSPDSREENRGRHKQGLLGDSSSRPGRDRAGAAVGAVLAPSHPLREGIIVKTTLVKM